jgi:AcrR family transcriptional regulator
MRPPASAEPRARIIAAAAEIAATRGEEGVTVSRVMELAGVSRQTFYEHFEDRSDCISEVLEEIAALTTARVSAAYANGRAWVERIRAGMLVLLELLDEEPRLAQLCVSRAVAGGLGKLTRRRDLLSDLVPVLEQGRDHAPAGHRPPAHAATCVIGGTLGMIHARLRGSDQPPLVDLLNPLMGMVVLPYLGEAAALRELSRPQPAAGAPISTARPLQELELRPTFRAATVLAIIAAEPGLSNADIARRAGIKDRGQTSRLLARLAGLELITTTGRSRGRGSANAWRLTSRGAAVEKSVRRMSPGARAGERRGKAAGALRHD